MTSHVPLSLIEWSYMWYRLYVVYFYHSIKAY